MDILNGFNESEKATKEQVQRIELCEEPYSSINTNNCIALPVPAATTSDNMAEISVKA